MRDQEQGQVLEQGRAAYGRRAWAEAYQALSQADAATPLAAADLERLAWSAALTGRDDALLATLERLYHAARRPAIAPRPRARSGSGFGWSPWARWRARAAGWPRAALVERADDCATRGYLMLPCRLPRLAGGDHGAAPRRRRAGRRDRRAVRRRRSRRVRPQSPGPRAAAARRRRRRAGAARRGRWSRSTAGELSPLVTGLVYCSVIATCQQVLRARPRPRVDGRAGRAGATRSRSSSPSPAACLVHRAEILQISAATGARRATRRGARRERVSPTGRSEALGDACYQQAEIHRLRGELDRGGDGLPRAPAASAASRSPAWRCCAWRRAGDDERPARIRRVLGATPAPWRARGSCPRASRSCSPAGDVDEARAAADELDEIAQRVRHRGAGRDGRPCARRGAARRGRRRRRPSRRCGARSRCWQRVGAPYLAARIRVLLAGPARRSATRMAPARAARRARQVFEELGAAPDLAALDGCSRDGPARRQPRADAARARGAAPGRPRQDEQGDRPRAVRQRADGRPPREQHLHQARRVVPRRRHRLRLRARAGLSGRVGLGRITHRHALGRNGGLCRSALALRALRA